MRVPRSTRGLLVAASAALALAGCPQATRIGAHAAGNNATATSAPAATNSAAPESAAPNAAALAEATRSVEFNLGPNRFVLPANWFVDGIGPDFQGGVTLALHWPSLEPYPPGQPYSSFTTGPMRHQAITVSIDYIDRVPIDELPERHVTQRPAEDPRDPTRNIALRDRLEDRFGLEHYVVNVDRLHSWVNRFPGDTDVPKERLVQKGEDWFIGRDASGRIRTVVQCDNGRRPDGEAIEGDRLVELPGSTRSPQCGGHLFAMPEYSISARAGYSRPLIRDWRRIESAVRDALRRAHDAANPQPSTGAPRP